MRKFSYIVQVHPVELYGPNLYKVKEEQEFATEHNALVYIAIRNQEFERKGKKLMAVYVGCVDTETGELVKVDGPDLTMYLLKK